MRRRDVLWAETAERDLERICLHVAGTDLEGALAIAARIEAAAARLDLLPLRGRIVPELRRFGVMAYREIVVAPWRVVYRVAEGSVHVVAVVDGRRNVEDVLLDRLATGGL